MPFTFSEINVEPDALGLGRWKVFFPDLPGVSGRRLSMLCTHVTLPQLAAGHIIVKLLGNSIAFRGGLQFDNTISFNFIENSIGEASTILDAWMKLRRDPETGLGQLKANYSRNIRIEIYNTTGEVALALQADRVYPLTKQYFELGEESGPAEIQTQFSCDALNMVQ